MSETLKKILDDLSAELENLDSGISEIEEARNEVQTYIKKANEYLSASKDPQPTNLQDLSDLVNSARFVTWHVTGGKHLANLRRALLSWEWVPKVPLSYDPIEENKE